MEQVTELLTCAKVFVFREEINMHQTTLVSYITMCSRRVYLEYRLVLKDLIDSL